MSDDQQTVKYRISVPFLAMLASGLCFGDNFTATYYYYVMYYGLWKILALAPQ